VLSAWLHLVDSDLHQISGRIILIAGGGCWLRHALCVVSGDRRVGGRWVGGECGGTLVP
jgi:hypothetical protein